MDLGSGVQWSLSEDKKVHDVAWIPDEAAHGLVWLRSGEKGAVPWPWPQPQKQTHGQKQYQLHRRLQRQQPQRPRRRLRNPRMTPPA